MRGGAAGGFCRRGRYHLWRHAAADTGHFRGVLRRPRTSRHGARRRSARTTRRNMAASFWTPTAVSSASSSSRMRVRPSAPSICAMRAHGGRSAGAFSAGRGSSDNDNAQGEYYLTDIPALAKAEGVACAVGDVDEGEVLGVNSRAELAAAEAAMQRRLRAAGARRRRRHDCAGNRISSVTTRCSKPMCRSNPISCSARA